MLNFIESIEVKPEVHIETKSQFTLTSGTQNERNTESQRKSIFDVVQRDSKGLQLDPTNNDKISDSGNYITVDLSKRTEQDAIDHLDRIVYKTKFSIYNGEIEENKCKKYCSFLLWSSFHRARSFYFDVILLEDIDFPLHELLEYLFISWVRLNFRFTTIL